MEVRVSMGLIFNKYIQSPFLFPGIMLGELKHGPLAMVDQDLPLIMLAPKDPTYTVSHCSRAEDIVLVQII